jgi:thymidylate synthase
MSRAHRNISFATVEGFDAVLRDGAVVTVRALETKELRNRITSITRPLERCIFLPGRRNDVFAQITETFWVIGGRNDLPWLRPTAGKGFHCQTFR